MGDLLDGDNIDDFEINEINPERDMDKDRSSKRDISIGASNLSSLRMQRMKNMGWKKPPSKTVPIKTPSIKTIPLDFRKKKEATDWRQS